MAMAEDDEQVQAAGGDILEESNAEASLEADKELEPEAPTVDLENLPVGERSALEVAESRGNQWRVSKLTATVDGHPSWVPGLQMTARSQQVPRHPPHPRAPRQCNRLEGARRQ